MGLLILDKNMGNNSRNGFLKNQTEKGNSMILEVVPIYMVQII